jgi:hypothetical protein
VGGILRLLDEERAVEFLDDLQVDEEEWLRKAREYSMETLTMDSPFQSFANLPALVGVPAHESSERRKAVLLGQCYVNDWTQVTLLDFLPSNLHPGEWGRSPSVEGRRALCNMLEYWELYFTIYFHSSFEGSLRALLTTFRTAVYLTKDDMYVRAQLEKLFASFVSDIFRRKVSAQFPEQSMEGGVECANLLKKYVAQYVDRLNGGVPNKEWTDSPHFVWYIEGQGYSLIKRATASLAQRVVKKELVKKELVVKKELLGTLESKAGAPPKGSLVPKGNKEVDDVCFWYVAQLVGMLDKQSGQLLKCHYSVHYTGNHQAHRALSEITQGEALLAVDNARTSDLELKQSVRAAVKVLKGWKQ